MVMRQVVSWLGRHRALSLIGGAAVTLLVAAVIAFFVFFQNGGTPVSVNEALHAFRHQRGGVVGSAALPPAGVYVYRTVGGEMLNLPNGDRSYPDRTTVTVTASGCGVALRWTALVEHVEEYDLCLGTGHALVMSSSSTTETFFGVESREAVSCSPTSYLRPPDARPWTLACAAPGIDWRGTGAVVGLEQVRVGRQLIPAIHTRVILNFTGRNTGMGPTDYWFAVDNSRLLRWVGTVDVSQGSSPLGSVHYHEKFDLLLNNAAPAH
jgi:hypothetical protein